jgi:hypothetical protein
MIPLPLPMIWGTYMKLVTKYQISAPALIKGRSTHLLPILDLIIPPFAEGGGGYTVLPLSGKLIKKICKTKMVLPYTNKKKRNKTVVIRKSHEKIFPSKIRLFFISLNWICANYFTYNELISFFNFFFKWALFKKEINSL